MPIAAGSDNYVDFHMPQGTAAKHNLFAYAEAGMPLPQVLQAATINAARLLGREGQLGVIKKGAVADIIAVEGDPVADIAAIRASPLRDEGRNHLCEVARARREAQLHHRRKNAGGRARSPSRPSFDIVPLPPENSAAVPHCYVVRPSLLSVAGPAPAADAPSGRVFGVLTGP